MHIIKLLESILKSSISDIEFEGIEEFNNIAEYKFSLQKANLVYSNGKKEEIFLKRIKGGKIKESIFCYWSLLYDEFLKENKRDTEDDLVEKAIITQVTSDESTSCLLLKLNAKLNYCAEINLVNLKSFKAKKLEKERWYDDLEIKDGEILFIGKKLY